jgi:hypothetical protein
MALTSSPVKSESGIEQTVSRIQRSESEETQFRDGFPRFAAAPHGRPYEIREVYRCEEAFRDEATSF